MDHKAINSLYHTNLRNIGLFTSISLALLGASRFYRAKGILIYNIGYILVSLVFTGMSLIMTRYLMEDHKYLIKNMKEKDTILLDKWYILPKILLFTNTIILCFTLYTLLRQFK